MQVDFYTFDKKYNSTKRPTGTATTYQCLLKTSSSIISPTIELNIGLATNPSSFNYAYISAYERYYWVSEWTFANTSWVASLNVDVLATWKPYIGDTNMYVYRSSATSDGTLFDKKYPTKSDATYSRIDLNQGYTNIVYGDGVFVVGIFGKNINNTSVCYYVFTPTNFSALLQELYATVNDTALWGVVEKGIRNSILDLSSYIKSCIWLPVDVASLIDTNAVALTSLDVGSFTLPATCYPLKNYSQPVPYRSFGFQIPKHPQASSRGVYCNLSPITRYKLIFMPYGVFEIDTTMLVNNSYLYGFGQVDPITGLGYLRCFATSQDLNLYPSTPQREILVSTAKVGIELPVILSSNNIASFVGTALGTAISIEKANVLGVIGGTIASACELALPNIDTVGKESGSLSMLNYPYNVFQARFFTIVDEDNNSNGRPLCKTRQPKNISGYIEADGTDFSCPATDGEQAEVRRFIDNGFYYE